jgi:hypothetical protein
MPISISLSAIHPVTDKPCPLNQEGHYSDLIFMRAFDTLPQAQAELDQKAALSTLLCKSCGAFLTSPEAALDM